MEMISPNDVLAKAKEMMLGGRDPETKDDWYRIINFVAVNFLNFEPLAVCKVMRLLYDIPLTVSEIEYVVKFQERKSTEKKAKQIVGMRQNYQNN